jgi:hypothetical protein
MSAGLLLRTRLTSGPPRQHDTGVKDLRPVVPVVPDPIDPLTLMPRPHRPGLLCPILDVRVCGSIRFRFRSRLVCWAGFIVRPVRLSRNFGHNSPLICPDLLSARAASQRPIEYWHAICDMR